MKRGLERKLLIAGSLWNLITSLLTIFSYNTWFSQEGTRKFEDTDLQSMILGTQLVDNISRVILTFGLLVFVGAIVSFIVALKMQDQKIEKYVMVWIGVWGIIQLLSMDIIGFVIYMIAFIIYVARNKAIRLAENQVE